MIKIENSGKMIYLHMARRPKHDQPWEIRLDSRHKTNIRPYEKRLCNEILKNQITSLTSGIILYIICGIFTYI